MDRILVLSVVISWDGKKNKNENLFSFQLDPSGLVEPERAAIRALIAL